MKKDIILVVSILLFLGQSNLFAEEFSWKDFVEGNCELRETTADTSDVVIICVEHSDTIDMYKYTTYPLYGDMIVKEEDKKDIYKYYGGYDKEGKAEEKPNSTLSELRKLQTAVMLDSGRLRIRNPEGLNFTVVKWPVAYYKDEKDGYCKSDKMFTLALIDKAYISKEFNDIAGSRENLDISEEPKLNVWLILFVVVCLLLVALTIYIFRLRKIVSNQEKLLSDKEETAEELKRDCKDRMMLYESVIQKIICEIRECITETMSKQFENIEGRLIEMSKGVEQSEQDLKQAIMGLRDVTPTEQKDTEFRTRDVSYSSKKFVLDENPQFGFFEIYSIKGEYYYTLPEERETRRSFIMYMTAYDSCVEADCTTQNPTIAVPIRDGHLFRTGDSFEVDKNCLLRVELREG
ncbi:MAG: hypothetical protein ACI3Y8_09780 [Candidatus Cryptobacteroides sp.]